MNTNTPMFDCYDQDELLAYIEDALDENAASALRERLQSDPDVANLIEAMRNDRRLLQRDPEPVLPVDFASELEPLLVRPMLMDAFEGVYEEQVAARPGQQRRRQRRHRRMRVVRRFAIAAAFALTGLGVTWIAYENIPSGLFQDHLASVQPPQAEPAELGDSPPSGAWDEPTAIIHHHFSSPAVGESMLAAVHNRAQRTADTANTQPVLVRMMLVIEAGDVLAAERALVEAADGLSSPTALVQNFSYDEARQLEQHWLMQQRPTSPSTEMVAGQISRLEQLAQRAADQMRTQRASFDGKSSEQLLGADSLAATLVQQLECSRRGATHTVTLAADQLQAFLAHLAMLEGHSTQLQSLSDNTDAQVNAPFVDRANVQQVLADIRELGGTSLIHLPVKLVHRQ